MSLPALIDTLYIEQKIHLIRNEKVILDFDLALIFGVPTKVLIQAIKRNSDRFPSDFLFRLNRQELISLRSQMAFTAEDKGRGGRRTIPQAFTEHGVIMAATVLNSPQAIQASLYVVRTFIKLRKMILAHRELAKKINELERDVATHDQAIRSLFDTIRKLMALPEKHKRKIGFDFEKF